MEARFSVPVQTGPGVHPDSCTKGIGYFPGVKSGWGVTLTPHPLLVPWSRKGRTAPLLPFWIVRPVQDLSACTRVTFTFTFRRLDRMRHHRAGTCHSKGHVNANNNISGKKQRAIELRFCHPRYRRFVGYSDWIIHQAKNIFLLS